MPQPANTSAAQASLVGERRITIARSFEAPRAVIWQAFTDPAVLAHWLLGPPGWVMQVCEVSLTVGGGYRWSWRHPKTGQEFGFKGTYSVVVPETKLVDAQTFDQGDHNLPAGKPTQNEVMFKDDGTGCHVSTTIRYPNAATRVMVMAQGIAEGMEASYGRLDRMLLKMAA